LRNSTDLLSLEQPPPARRQAPAEWQESAVLNRAPSFGCSRRSEQGPGKATRSVSDGTRGAVDADRCARDGGNVRADLERIANVLTLDLLRERWKIDGKIAVRLAMLRDKNSCQVRVRVEADEHLDRPIISTLERLQLGRPEHVARDRRRAGIAG